MTARDSYVTCETCKREDIPDKLFAAHLRRVHDGRGWFAEREAVAQARAGIGNRNRGNTEGRGTARQRWARRTGTEKT